MPGLMRCGISNVVRLRPLLRDALGSWTTGRAPALRPSSGQLSPQQDRAAASSEAGNEAVYQRVAKRLGPFSTRPVISGESPLVVVVSGPSGVGKDSVIRRLRERRPDVHVVVTATTRAMRINEIDGQDYHFVSKETFEGWIEQDQMFEYAQVYGDYKGIPKLQIEEALEKGKDYVQGAAYLRKQIKDCITVYISPQSEDELVKRLIARNTETEEDTLLRVKTARAEMKRATEFDYIVTNKEGGMELCVERICSILDAERSKRTRLPAPRTP